MPRGSFPRPAPEVRFWKYVSPEPMSGCWLWTAYLCNQGYGIFGQIRGKNIKAHRYSYGLVKGPIPKGLQLDHKCRVRSCVNPDHLRAVTPRENVLAPGSLAPSAANAKRTHCKNGHPLGELRRCVPCRKQYEKEYRLAHYVQRPGPKQDPMARFSKHLRSEPTGCMVWTGFSDTGGTGRFRIDGKSVGAPRFAWEVVHGPVPESHYVVRNCATRGCMKVDHHELAEWPRRQ